MRLCAAVIALCVAAPASAQTIDTFDDVNDWRAAPASGVELQMSADAGHSGKALRVDFDFHGGGGWAAFRKEIAVELTDNYEISFWLKGDAPRNTLELKLIDPSGDNVWWINRRDFEYAGDWRRISFRKRHVRFAWGPAGGGEIHRTSAIEFAITAGTGGKGTIWIDDLTITPREAVRPYDATPVVTVTASDRTIDFTRNREYGGIIVDWKARGSNRSYDVQVSQDGKTWQTVRTVHGGMRATDYLLLSEMESRFLRLALRSNARAQDMVGVRVMPLEWGESRNAMFDTIAMHSPAGSYPKYYSGVQSYWTVIGENGASSEALINEEGAIEVEKQSFSLEPFIYTGDSLIDWHDVQRAQSLREESLPIPTVTWHSPNLTLETTSWADSGVLWVRYRVTRTAATSPARLYVAIRPFQVNPPTQFLNTPGGATSVRSIARASDGSIRVDAQQVVAVTTPAAFGAATFDAGDIVDYMRRGELPAATSVTDSFGSASAAFAFALDPAKTVQDVYIAFPREGAVVVREPEASLRATIDAWRAELAGFDLTMPDPRIAASIRSNLAYILINRDGAAIQPGSRSYERSWIRDGSLTSDALLRLGHYKEVHDFIAWYAPYQYADGKVPCCVDQHGAGPVPENDSHGQLIYLIAEYLRYTADTTFVRGMYPHVVRAVTYMDSLRNSRRTAQYRGTAFFGLMPQSISHEGYSAKPMHSYWDDFFALKGFKDATWLARGLGDTAHAAVWARMRDEFQADLMQSFRIALQQHGIDYLPGAAELGDFDATSTTVGVSPAGAQRDLPPGTLKATFDRYWDNFTARRDSNDWDAYTPYEWRVAGTYVRMAEKQRAHALFDWFMQHQRPSGWNHWAEVVGRERDQPRFIGDMPHTWVGSDFIRSALDIVAYDDDDALILAAGILPAWVRSAHGVGVSGLHTPYGVIAYQMRMRGSDVAVTFQQRPTPPPKGFIIRSPLDQAIRSAKADGVAVEVNDREVKLRALPRELVLTY